MPLTDLKKLLPPHDHRSFILTDCASFADSEKHPALTPPWRKRHGKKQAFPQFHETNETVCAAVRTQVSRSQSEKPKWFQSEWRRIKESQTVRRQAKPDSDGLLWILNLP
jgi:hypothetical protein